MNRIVYLLVISFLVFTFILSEGIADTLKWKSVKSPTRGALRAICFADVKTVIAVGDNGTIIKSADAGKKWKKQDSSVKATLRGLHFTDAKHGWACGDGDPSAPRVRKGHVVIGAGSTQMPKCGSCLTTSNGGKTWENIWVQTNFELRSIWMCSKKAGQLCNHGGEDHADGDTVMTKDGGKTWSQKRIWRGLNDCFWFNEKEGWAVGSRPFASRKVSRIVHTTDSGANWEAVNMPDIGGQKQLRSVWFVDKEFGCAVGDEGAILVTTDSGRKWTFCKRVTDKNLYAVCFMDKKKGWAVGEDGLIIKTTDGGKNWKKEKSPVAETLYGLHFNKNKKGATGIAVGEKGTIIRLGS